MLHNRRAGLKGRITKKITISPISSKFFLSHLSSELDMKSLKQRFIHKVTLPQLELQSTSKSSRCIQLEVSDIHHLMILQKVFGPIGIGVSTNFPPLSSGNYTLSSHSIINVVDVNCDIRDKILMTFKTSEELGTSLSISLTYRRFVHSDNHCFAIVQQMGLKDVFISSQLPAGKPFMVTDDSSGTITHYVVDYVDYSDGVVLCKRLDSTKTVQIPLDKVLMYTSK